MANEWMTRYQSPGYRWGLSQNQYNKMISAGYSNQQVVAGVRSRNLTIGDKVRPFLQSGAQPIWMNQYTGSEGNIGLTSYQRMIDSGRTPFEIQADQHLSGMSFGALARAQLKTDIDAHHAAVRAEDDKRWEERIAHVPTIEELVAAMPEPKIKAGQDYALTGRSAAGMRIKKGTKFTEGGKRGTKGYFGRGAKFKGNTAPVMNIGGGGGGTGMNTA